MIFLEYGCQILCLTALLPLSIQASYECEPGWFLHEDECHLFVSNYLRTWSRARQFCSSYAADLAKILNAARQNFIRSHVGSSKYWIGLNDLVREKKYVWLSETQRATYYYWGGGEPSDNRGENCVEIKYGKWNDKECDAELKFICQKAAVPSAVLTTEGPMSTSCSICSIVSGNDPQTVEVQQDKCTMFSRGEMNGTLVTHFESFPATNISDCASHCVSYPDCRAFTPHYNGLCLLSNSTNINVSVNSHVFIRK